MSARPCVNHERPQATVTVQFPAISAALGKSLDPLVSATTRVTVLGLGYVGLPLAVALAKQFFVTGFARVKSIRTGSPHPASA